MSDVIKGEYESYKGLWQTVSDTDKVGIVSHLEGLLRRSDAASDVDLSAEIENTIATIRRELDNSRS